MRAADGRLGDVLTGSRTRPREAEGAGKLEILFGTQQLGGEVRRIVMTPDSMYTERGKL